MHHVACQTSFRLKKRKQNSPVMAETTRLRDRHGSMGSTRNETTSYAQNLDKTIVSNDPTQVSTCITEMINTQSTTTPSATVNTTSSQQDMNNGHSSISTPSLPHVNDLDLQHIMNNLYSEGPQLSSINVMGDFIRQIMNDYHKTVSFVIIQAIQDRRISIDNALALAEEQQTNQTSLLMFLASIRTLQEKVDTLINSTSQNEPL